MVKDGGWWFSPDGLDDDSIVYSLGVGDEINFDLALVDKYGVEVFAFDPTPNSVDMLDASRLPDKFHFHPWAVTAKDGTLEFYPRLKKDGTKSDVMFTMIPEEETLDDVIEVPAYCLSTIIGKLGHTHIDLLKMDIEGAEYEVLDGLLDSPVLPTQLLVEFHHRFVENGIDRDLPAHRAITRRGIRHIRHFGNRTRGIIPEAMKTLTTMMFVLGLVSACGTSSGTRRSQITDCPIGMVLICETRREQELSRGGDEEIPEYEHCYCEQVHRY